jgi:cell shape-determining protein MreC
MIIAIIAIIIIIYATVAGMFFFRDRRFAEKINEAIKRRRR